MFHEKSKNDQLRVNLDFLDEVKEKSFNKMTKYKQKMAEYYNKRVKPKRLDMGDLVLRKATPATRDSVQGKLGPTWEGPYLIVHYFRQDSYHLETMDGQRLPRPWNIEHLKKYHNRCNRWLYSFLKAIKELFNQCSNENKQQIG